MRTSTDYLIIRNMYMYVALTCSALLSRVIGHFVPRSFRTQVISYHFGHFVPIFIFNLVISYPVGSFRTHFVLSLVISYLLLLFSRKPFWSFRTYFSRRWFFKKHKFPNFLLRIHILRAYNCIGNCLGIFQSGCFQQCCCGCCGVWRRLIEGKLVLRS